MATEIAQGPAAALPNPKRAGHAAIPANIDAERAVIGALLMNDEYFSLAAEWLVPDEFYHMGHRLIFQLMLEIHQSGRRIDLVTLQDELVKRAQLERVGGLSYLVSLQEELPVLALVEQHARIVKEKAVLRELIACASSIIGTCYEQNNDDLAAVLDHAEKTIFQIAKKRSTFSFVQLSVWLKTTFKHLSEIKSSTKGVTGTSSGFGKLDRFTSGFQKGDLIVLAARPSMGKTALALEMAAHAARSGAVVGFFSLEMAAEQLVLRLLSSLSGIPHQNIRNATISSQEWSELVSVAGTMAEMNMFIDDTPTMSVLDLRTRARKLKADHGLSILFVDYLQLLCAARRYENRHQEVSDISRSLKALAKELEIPVVALSQLSRAVDSRMDKRPILSDLRESGAIEQDADLIMFLYREVVYNSETENPALAELIIGKQRNGPTGTVPLTFVRELTRFEDSE